MCKICVEIRFRERSELFQNCMYEYDDLQIPLFEMPLLSWR